MTHLPTPSNYDRQGRSAVRGDFLTDGRPTVGITGEGQIVQNVGKAAGNTRVFCFGIGTDVNAHLLDKITEETRASAPMLHRRKILIKFSFYTKIKEPVLANPKLEFSDGIRVTKLYPNPLPDLFRGEELVLVGRYKGKGDSDVMLEGTLAGKKTQLEFPVTFPAQADHDFIPRLWATRRVGYLLDEIRLRGENKELKDEVTTLARKYGIVTPYTAYLIIEDEQRRGVPVAQRTLRNFEADREVLEQTRKQFEALKLDKAGDQASARPRREGIKGSDERESRRQNSNLQAQQANFGFANSAPTVPTDGGLGGRAGQLFFADTKSNSARAVSQPMEFAAGKNFTQNAQFWVDSDVQAAEVAKAKRSRIAFNSDAYFNLLAMEPKVAQWLALGGMYNLS